MLEALKRDVSPPFIHDYIIEELLWLAPPSPLIKVLVLFMRGPFLFGLSFSLRSAASLFFLAR